LTSEGHILRAVGNSLVVAVSTAILTTILATAAGYGLGRFRFRGSNVAFALYAFLAAWTEFLGALTFLTSENLYTLPVSLVNLQLGAYGEVNYGFLAAGAVIAMIPCVILFVALQRYYMEGMAA